ncbi:MAG: ABC transporter permease subunit [Verrucomicrobiota bacterium]|nr:ABC transporter permease subunit [Verrucomicrobiota bacterium]
MRSRRGLGIIALHVITWGLLVIVAAPILVVLAGAFLDSSLLGVSTERWADVSGRGHFVHGWFGYVLNLYGGSIRFSLILAVLSVVVCVIVSVPAAYAIVGSKTRAGRVLEELTLLPLSIPGIAMSIALIQAYTIIRGRWWLIFAGHVLYTVPLMMRVVANALRSFDLERLQTAAQTLGAKRWQQFAFVVVPNLRHSIVVGSLLVFAISWGEFNVSFLLNTPLNQTYPAALYSTYTANSFAVSSAATTIFLAVIIPVLLALQWAGGREFTRLEQAA